MADTPTRPVKKTSKKSLGAFTKLKGTLGEVVASTPAELLRHHLPDTHHSITHRFSVGGHEGYLTVGLYEDGQPGELFITMTKEGSTVGGLMDVIGTFTSIALQYGIPLITLVDKCRHTRFEPSGVTSNRDIPFAKSLIDYIFCWLGCQFIHGYAEQNTPNRAAEAGTKESINTTTGQQLIKKSKDLAQKIAETRDEVKIGDLMAGTMPRCTSHFQNDAPVCDICGAITMRHGTCYKCFNCGNSIMAEGWKAKDIKKITADETVLSIWFADNIAPKEVMQLIEAFKLLHTHLTGISPRVLSENRGNSTQSPTHVPDEEHS